MHMTDGKRIVWAAIFAQVFGREMDRAAVQLRRLTGSDYIVGLHKAREEAIKDAVDEASQTLLEMEDVEKEHWSSVLTDVFAS